MVGPLSPSSYDLALAGPGFRSYRCPNLALGRGTRYGTGVVAQAMARTERDGPPVEGAETAHGRASASGSYRATGRGGCRVGTPTAPTRSPAQSGHPLSGVLASRGVTRFLSTHLVLQR